MTNETTAVAQAEASERKLSEKDLRSIFWRSCILDCPWTYERQQNMGYSYAMVPAIDKLYEKGSDIISDAASGGIMEKITYAASIVGLMAIGGMIASFIWFDSSLIVIGSGEYATSLLEYLEMIMPCLPQLLVFGIMYWIMGKNVKTTWVLLGTIVLSIAAFGIVSLF